MRMATILVAEDDATVLSLLRDFLEQEGHTVLAARDGSEALTIARRELPDLVLSDIMMPVMDGIEMIRMLRGDSPTREVAVILMSAVQPRNLAAVGAAGFIAKPFRIDVLGRLIADHLAAGHP
jgi:CheY-like chemotaxis protein